ncbi:MAG TPA: T9SS type A sorting domain-containing protein, partial [Bacteroidota bacterium]|nr:T9SS type A sorting domain-containing protein [Bacteroidota bacterium]
YNTSSSQLPDNCINAIAVEQNGTKWIGTPNGLAEFDGVNWKIYNTTNSNIPSNFIYSIAIEDNGTKWIGTTRGVAAYDGNNWAVYNTSNSGLPRNGVSSIAIAKYGIKWFGTDGGVAKFDGGGWQIFNVDNSDLPDNAITTIVVDKKNNTKWIGTYNGLAAYNEAGDPLNVEEMVYQSDGIIIYPNPADEYINIANANLQIERVEIIDMQGRIVGSKSITGTQANMNISNLTSGIYIMKIYTNRGIKVGKLIKR